ncbi:MAG: PilZ domain-containing protein [Candidatus Omnitrophica bacterium]|nr:PilZ domain-containing protein [Candidatus Omnitrophota bacterium]
MKEKRKHIRFQVLMDALGRLQGSEKKIKVNNLSRTGFGVITEEPLDRGSEFEIELRIPGDNIPVIVTGEIAWTKQLTPTKTRSKASQIKNIKHESGIKVKSIKSTDRNRLLEFIYNKWMKK